MSVFADATLINQVQGSSFESPLLGQQVIIEGVVTAVHPHLSGFFLQEELVEQDDNALTSEAVFVSAKDYDLPMTGDIVRAIGNVSEQYGKTTVSLSQAALQCGVDSVPATSLSLPFASAEQAEALEGMYIIAEQALTVTDSYNLGRYGEVTLSNGLLYIPTNKFAPR